MNTIALLGIATYFLAAIPFALVVSKLKGIDLRSIGSGNLGATNVVRGMGWGFGVLVLGLDALKGYLPVMYALNSFESPWIHVGIGALAIASHSLSVFVKFKGGKGAATGLGVLLALSPDVFLIVFSVAVIAIGVTRYVAPTTIFCAFITPILLYVREYPTPYIIVLGTICFFIIVRHHSNIKRVFQGKENKVEHLKK